MAQTASGHASNGILMVLYKLHNYDVDLSRDAIIHQAAPNDISVHLNECLSKSLKFMSGDSNSRAAIQ